MKHLRVLRLGSRGEDVRCIQQALNQAGAHIEEDGSYGTHTRDAVVAFQEKNDLDVDGEVGRETRKALFPLVTVTVSVLGMRLNGRSRSTPNWRERAAGALSPGRLTLGDLSAPTLPLHLSPPIPPPGLFSSSNLDEIAIPGLADRIAAAPLSFAGAASTGSGPDWQQFAQTQRQFTRLFGAPYQDTFGVGIQSVFNRSDNDNHVEVATGCLLQGPIGIQTPGGNPMTVACFAQATWVDPILHFGRFHLAAPFAQAQVQGNTSGPVNPTLQLAGFPINIGVDLETDGSLQLQFQGGGVWSVMFTDNGIVSSWGTQAGIGLVGRFRLFGN